MEINKNFNIAEIFEIAEQIERNGAEFYTNAAEHFNDIPDLKQLLLKLAKEEKNHEVTFCAFKKDSLIDEILVDINDEITAKYLHAVAAQFVFKKSDKSMFSNINNSTQKQDIFKFAIEREKNAILLYLGIKDIITDKKIQKNVEFLMREEMKHLSILTKYAETYKFAVI